MIAELNRGVELSGLGFEMETLYETKFADIKFFDKYSEYKIYGGEF